LSLRRSDGEVFTQDAIVDTGFNGWLSLPPEAIALIHLRILANIR
jgi:predicted aspartyl protease